MVKWHHTSLSIRLVSGKHSLYNVGFFSCIHIAHCGILLAKLKYSFYSRIFSCTYSSLWHYKFPSYGTMILLWTLMLPQYTERNNLVGQTWALEEPLKPVWIVIWIVVFCRDRKSFINEIFVDLISLLFLEVLFWPVLTKVISCLEILCSSIPYW